MDLNEYINKYAGIKQVLKASKIAIRRGSIGEGAVAVGVTALPAAMLIGGTMTTAPAAIQKGSVIGAAAITAGSAGAGAVINTARHTSKILRRSKRIKNIK